MRSSGRGDGDDRLIFRAHGVEDWVHAVRPRPHAGALVGLSVRVSLASVVAPLATVATLVRRQLRVAVRTDESQILSTVVLRSPSMWSMTKASGRSSHSLVPPQIAQQPDWAAAK